MVLSSIDLEMLSSIATKAALDAGALIREYTDKQVDVVTKITGASLASQVLTEVDLLSQELILNALLPTCSQYDLALLSEEKVDDGSRFEKDYFWCIDPLDGTLPFTEKVAGYSVSIALVSRSGESLLGVIYDPVEDILYEAIKGKGCKRNGKSFVVKHKQDNNYLTFVSDRSFMKHQSIDFIQTRLNEIALQNGYARVETVVQGGAAMNACWSLEYAPACYFKFPKKENGGGSLWDYAASACIFSESGAVATSMNGDALDLNRKDSTFMNHQGVLYASNSKLASQIMELYQEIEM